MASDYEVEIFRAQGFQRRQCPRCSTWFWTLGEQITCRETPCVEYTFIGAPPFSKKLTTKAMREDFLSFLEVNGHTRVKRYPTGRGVSAREAAAVAEERFTASA